MPRGYRDTSYHFTKPNMDLLSHTVGFGIQKSCTLTPLDSLLVALDSPVQHCGVCPSFMGKGHGQRSTGASVPAELKLQNLGLFI